jgi:hypothetical protein
VEIRQLSEVVFYFIWSRVGVTYKTGFGLDD